MPRFLPQLAAKKDGPKKAVLELYDDIGPWWLGMIDAKSVARAIKDAGGDELEEIEVRINSMGGSVCEGLAIHNLLRQHKAKILVRIDGLAASIASVIACAGDQVVMPASALIFVHNPWTIAVGEKTDFEKTIELLDTCKESCVACYARKTGKDAATLGGWMDQERWLNAAAAKDAGFADVVLDAAEAQAAFHPEQFKARFRNVPLDVAALLRPADAGGEPDPMSTPAPAAAATPPTATAAPTAGTFTQADLDAARKDAADKAVAAEAKRQADVRALCKEANLADQADHFCADAKFTLADVREHLFNQLCKRNNPPAENGEGGTGVTTPPTDPHAGFRKEFAAQQKMYESLGVSEDEYVRSRCRDEGIASPAA